MPRRSVKTRQPKMIQAALGMTLIAGVYWYFFFLSGGFGGRSTPTLAIAISLVAVLVWAVVIYALRRQNAAGKTLEELKALSSSAFEEWTAARIRDLGYSVSLTGTAGDHGIDLIARKPGETAVIRCKAYKSWSVGEPLMRDLFGAMHDVGADRAYLHDRTHEQSGRPVGKRQADHRLGWRLPGSTIDRPDAKESVRHPRSVGNRADRNCSRDCSGHRRRNKRVWPDPDAPANLPPMWLHSRRKAEQANRRAVSCLS